MIQQAESTAAERIQGSARDRFDMHDEWVKFVSRHIFEYQLSTSFPKGRTFEIEAQGRTYDDWTVGRVSTVEGKARLIHSRSELSRETRARYVAYISLRGDIE